MIVRKHGWAFRVATERQKAENMPFFSVFKKFGVSRERRDYCQKSAQNGVSTPSGGVRYRWATIDTVLKNF